MKTESIIEKVVVHHPQNEHIARIRGEESVPKSWYYRNKVTGAEYSFIAGGLGLPDTQTPGGAVVVAADRGEAPVLRVLAAVEHGELDDLLHACIGLREKYGFTVCADLFRFWYGDPDRLASLRNDFNIGLDSTDGVHVSPPSDWDKKDRYQIYMRRIRDLGGGGRLLFDSSTYLANQIQKVEPGDIGDTLPDKFPTLAALGYAVHSISMFAPWRKPLSPESTRQTVESETLAAMDEQDAFDFGDEDEYDDDGGLIGTV